MRHKILAIDDETDLLKLLEYNLRKEGFDCISEVDGPEGLSAARRERPSLILLDIMLPNMEGTEVLKDLKADPATRPIPVVMLTAKGEEIDRIIGLELGADDFIIKPFSLKELVLRIKAILREKPSSDEVSVIRKGCLVVDLDRFSAEACGEKAGLTPTEFRILVELINSRGRTLNREFLMRRVSTQEGHTTTRTVDSHIKRIREKLGPCKECIETIRGFGYRFNEEAVAR